MKKKVAVLLLVLMLILCTTILAQPLSRGYHTVEPIESVFYDIGATDGFVLAECFVIGDYTIIELTDDELQQLQVARGRSSEGTIVGGTLVLPGTFPPEIQAEITRHFIEGEIDVSYVTPDEPAPFSLPGIWGVRNVREEGDTWFWRDRLLAFGVAHSGVTITISEIRHANHQINTSVNILISQCS